MNEIDDSLKDRIISDIIGYFWIVSTSSSGLQFCFVTKLRAYYLPLYLFYLCFAS